MDIAVLQPVKHASRKGHNARSVILGTYGRARTTELCYWQSVLRYGLASMMSDLRWAKQAGTALNQSAAIFVISTAVAVANHSDEHAL